MVPPLEKPGRACTWLLSLVPTVGHSSPVRILVAGHKWPSGPCPLHPAQCVQDTMGQEGAVQLPALCKKTGVQAAERNHCRMQGPRHRDCSEGTLPIKCCSVLHAHPWQVSMELGLSPPRAGGVLLTRAITPAEPLCHGHRPHGAEHGR